MFDEKLNIIVKDDGIGMNPEKLNKIRDGLANELEFDQEEKSYTRIGLLNVVKRLKLIYGSNAHFSIESVPNKGTTIKIEILVEAIEKVYEDNLEYL